MYQNFNRQHQSTKAHNISDFCGPLPLFCPQPLFITADPEVVFRIYDYPISAIAHSSCSHLGWSQGSHQLECNGRHSLSENCPTDHC